jgi:Uma2 family endonuclease
MSANPQPTAAAITEEDLMRLDAQNERYEVVNGELHEMAPVGMEHGWFGGNVYRTLFAYVSEKRLGLVFGDSVIHVLERRRDGGILKARVPDVSFIRRGRIPPDYDFKRPFEGAPDLAIEVVSPTESATELEEKRQDYFAYGTEQVWVIYPGQRRLYQHRADQPEVVRVYQENEMIEAGELLAGGRFALATFLSLPDLGATTAD